MTPEERSRVSAYDSQKRKERTQREREQRAVKKREKAERERAHWEKVQRERTQREKEKREGKEREKEQREKEQRRKDENRKARKDNYEFKSGLEDDTPIFEEDAIPAPSQESVDAQSTQYGDFCWDSHQQQYSQGQ
ncbi:hypothetical protein B9479_007242 [Cryptococcus floricola]|uniref:Uncharacterized protein n=1 Tax=Cryptococcus floricola TaxID=2591691 RepID=A0A5D3APC9_9TREE|nr:hypothetical protein B9479_007242 [Cryptococcus floricola]